MPPLYAARDYGPDWMALAAAQTVSLEVYRSNALVAPSAGTFSLLDPVGTVVVDEQAVTVASDVATYNLTSDHTDSDHIGEGWLQRWTLTLDGVSHLFQRPAALVRSRLFPVITDNDLEGEYSDIASLRPSELTSYQGYIDAAWKEIVGELYRLGNWPYLICDPWALRAPHLHRVLEKIWRDFSKGQGEGSAYLALAEKHNQEWFRSWRRLSFRYDSTLAGRAASSKDFRSAQGSGVWTNHHRRLRWDL